ncbi:MAG: S-layer homology domain-containing protein [Oscillospiraceae bacterium]|nr:S-layer homology domain-containing protein [Oscillospiraceae bacterium]
MLKSIKNMTKKMVCLALALCVALGCTAAAFADGAALADGEYALYIDRLDAPDFALELYETLEEAADADGVDDWLIYPTEAERVQRYYGIEVSYTSGYSAADAAEWAYSVYAAFLCDHPEVFWLSGNLSFITYGERVYLVLYNEESRSGVWADEYTTSAQILTDIARQEQYVQQILSALDGSETRYEKVRYINNWLTTHNQYNTVISSGGNESSLGHYPWTALCALAGSTGSSGPVCEGYAKAFKLLCDELGIPCVYVTGGGHAWNNVKMKDGCWYAVDVTYNDPVQSGRRAVASSGLETENYLLVGSATVIDGDAFSQSHTVENRLYTNGIAFTNEPTLSTAAYDPDTVEPADLPFDDVDYGEWYTDAVIWAYENGVTTGATDTSFDTLGVCTRAQVVTFLWRACGSPQPESADCGFADVAASDYFYSAVLWAVENGITVGTGEGEFSPYAECSGAHVITFLSRALDAAEETGESWYSAAVEWAEAQGLLSGTNFTADSPATRAQIVTWLYRALA